MIGQLSSYEINGKIFEPKNEKSIETTGVLPLHTYTVKLGFKELLNKEQIDNSHFHHQFVSLLNNQLTNWH